MTLELIKQLTATASRNGKEDLVKEAFLAGERNFFIGMNLGSDPRVSFGVKKVPLVDESEDDGTDELGFDDFLKLANRLRSRELTGNMAIEAMVAAAERSSNAMWNNFYRRILIKNFQVGASHKTMNRVLAELVAEGNKEAADYILPVFGCQLAQDCAKHPKKLTGEMFVDFKFDGVRLLSFIDIESKSVTQLTGRNGTPNENFPHLRAELEKLIPYLPVSVVMDAEVIGSSFKEIMQQISRKDDVSSNFARLAIFDMISMADFNKGVSELTQEQRHNGLVSLVESGIFAEAGITACEVLPKFKIDFDTPEGRAKFTELQEQVLAIRAAATEETPTAVEGLMIKRKKGPYRVGKKGTDWLKWKPYIEVTLRVTGVEYGDADKSRAGKVAALICEGEDDGVKYKTNVSSGITHDDSDAWTDDPSLIIDWMVEIAADAATQDEKAIGTDVFSLRFPRYKGKRGTKPGEKI